MEQSTREFLELLSSLESKQEVVSNVINEVDRCKMSLQDKGYRFYAEEHTDDLVGGQGIRNRDLEETRYMDEIAHIKRGVTSEWVARLDGQARFNEIRDQVDDIIFGL